MPPLTDQPRVAVVGSGPAGLMTAHVLASAGVLVHVFEKRPSAGRKILIAGSSGLNISYDCLPNEIASFYRGPQSFFEKLFKNYSRENWIQFVEGLGLETFKGTSRRYFVKEMKGSGLLRAWTEKLRSLGVQFEFGKEATGFEVKDSGEIRLQLNKDEERTFDAICFCLGGGSWEPQETPLRWTHFFKSKKISITPFEPSNTGFEVDWPAAFLKEAEGLPLKSIAVNTSLGQKKGELMITEYGLEGTPIYAIGKVGTARIDLKPGLTAKEIESKLLSSKENLAPMRRVKKYLNLCEGSEALLFHLTPPEKRSDLKYLISMIKSFPIQLKQPRPLQESISSSGGLAWKDIGEDLMLKNFLGVFAAGEMLDWDAPTGGFLIQACVSQGDLAGKSILWFLNKTT